MSSAKMLVAEVVESLAAARQAHRAGTVDGHSRSALEVLGVPVPQIRARVRDLAKRLRDRDAAVVVEVVSLLVQAGSLEARQVGYELLGRREDARARLGPSAIETLGRGNDNWKSVDAFACEVAGPCWREGRLKDAAIHRWARSKDRWWRRTALVSTVPLNTRSRGGSGDAPRTLAVCALCAADRDDMVIKACSWALRELAPHDPAAVRAFLGEHDAVLAARVRREVKNVLTTGRKNPRPRRRD